MKYSCEASERQCLVTCMKATEDHNRHIGTVTLVLHTPPNNKSYPLEISVWPLFGKIAHACVSYPQIPPHDAPIGYQIQRAI